MSFTMTRQECQDFLAGGHVGIVCVAEQGRGPLAVPVWYIYERGRNPSEGDEVWISTGKDSRKVQLIKSAGRFSLCVQNEAPPYKYVSVEGPVTAIEVEDTELHSRPLARRYLGQQGGDKYIADMLSDPQYVPGVVVYLRPERWYSADFSE